MLHHMLFFLVYNIKDEEEVLLDIDIKSIVKSIVLRTINILTDMNHISKNGGSRPEFRIIL
jgi:hypothetical protein